MSSIPQALLPAWNFSSLKKCHPTTAADAFIKKSNWSVLLKVLTGPNSKSVDSSQLKTPWTRPRLSLLKLVTDAQFCQLVVLSTNSASF